MVKETEFYDALGITLEAVEADIKRAYRKMALKYHPDKNPGNEEAAEMFKKLGEAYETLSDPEKKKKYDQYGKKGLEEGGGGGFHDASDIFSMFFGGGQKRGGEPKPKDIVHELPVSLEEMYCGKIKKIAATRDRFCKACEGKGCKAGASEATCEDCKGHGVRIMTQQIMPGFVQQMQVKCSKCSGQGKWIPAKDLCPDCSGNKVAKERKVIEIPIEKGTKKGDVRRFAGEGDQKPGMSQAGDVLIILGQKPHDVFRRVGNHLLMNHTITLQEALCGFELPVEHLDKRTINIKVPSGQVIDPNFAWIVNREGMPVPGTGGVERGNLILYFDVQLPTSLDAASMAKLSEALNYKYAKSMVNGAEQVKLSEYVPKPKARGGYGGRRAAHDDDDDDDDEDPRQRGGGGGGPGGQQVQCQQQ